MQIRLAVITLTILFALIFCGSASAAYYVTTTDLTFNHNSAASGDQITCKAHVERFIGGASVPAGLTVTFRELGGSVIGTGTTDSNGNAYCTYTVTSNDDKIIRASFAQQSTGGNTYFASQDDESLDVHGTTTSLTVNQTSTNVGNSVTLSSRLRSGGSNLEGRTIRFMVDGVQVGTGTTGSDGRAYYTYTPLTSGTKNIQAVFYGNLVPEESWLDPWDYYRGSSSSIQSLTVNANSTSLVVDPASGYKGEQTTLRATLTSGGSPLSGKTVNFFINGNPVGSGTTDSNGVATYLYTISENVGTYTSIITAVFDEDSQYLTSNGANSLTVNAIPTSLTVDPASGYKGDSTTLRAVLWDIFHNVAIAGRQVDFYVNGVLAGSGTTDVNGVATYVYTIAENVGTHLNYITAVFTADTQYASSNGANSLTVDAIPTSLTVDPVSGYKGDDITLKAKLWDIVHDKAVIGKTVDFYVNSVLVGSGATDANGVATYVYTITEDVGTYLNYISAVFVAGDDQYAEASGNNTLTVNAIPTKLTVENVIGNKGHSVDLKAKLWDTFHDKAVAGKQVDFYVKGVKVGSATTDANGVATLSYYIDLVGGAYDINAEYAVDGQYAGSTGNGTLKVPQSGVYVITTTSKNNPTVGETIKITFKLGNEGPDTAEDVKFTYVLPEGLELMNISGDGDYSYDPVTRTITWNLGDVPVGDPWLYVMVKVLKSGSFTIDPSVSTITYDPNLSSSIQFATVNAVTQVKAASKTIPLQKTGLPLAGLVLAVLAIFGGLIMPKGKN